MKEQLLDLITKDYLKGDICCDSSSTLSFIKDLVNLLNEDQLNKFAMIYGYKLSTWYKLKDEQIKQFNIKPYNGEVILINPNAEHIRDKFYFNAQEYFSDEYLDNLELYGE